MIRPPSSIVGTTPLGFMSRYHFWSLPPNAMPTFSRSYFSPHSSAHHSTFITLIELARPQIFIACSSQWCRTLLPRHLAQEDRKIGLRRSRTRFEKHLRHPAAVVRAVGHDVEEHLAAPHR